LVLVYFGNFLLQMVFLFIPFQDDYLQIDLGSIYKIKNIAVQGLATSYCIQYGKDGKTYKPYGLRASTCDVRYFYSIFCLLFSL
jgi:hypothetical protein